MYSLRRVVVRLVAALLIAAIASIASTAVATRHAAAGGTATFPFRANRAVWELLKRMPKVETHDHLGGGMPRQAFRQLCRRHGNSPRQVAALVDELKPPYHDVADFLRAYRACINANMTTPEDFRIAAREIVKQAGAENVSFLAVRERLSGVGVPPDELLRAVERGLREGARWVAKRYAYQIRTGFVVAISRSCEAGEAVEAARLTRQWAKRRNSLVIGFDVAGDEAHHPITKHAAACNIVTRAGIPLTVHAGESPRSARVSGKQSMRDAVRLGAASLGHGRFAADPLIRDLFSKRRSKPAAVEACPLSNYALGYVASLSDHPLREQLREGLNVNLGTDDPLFFTASRRPYTEQLYQLWASGQLTSWEQLKTIVRNGASWPLIPSSRRAELKAEVDKQLQAIETDPRFRKTIDRFLSPARGN